MKHPIQKIHTVDGVVRFVENPIVRALLDDGPFSLNDIATWNVSREDREQFAQLIGYSVKGAGELNYVSDTVFNCAARTDSGGDPNEHVVTELTAHLEGVKDALRYGVAKLYGIHPDDLNGTA